MKLFTKEIEKALAANASVEESTRRPVLKLFGGGACTWLISERIDDDTLCTAFAIWAWATLN